MALTYTWNAALEWLRAYGRNIPIDKVGAQICDAVSSEMWSKYTWKDSCQTIPPQLLEDGIQDYDSPPSFFKLVAGQIVRLTPGDVEGYDPLDVVEGIPFRSTPVHPSQIRAFSMERGVGLMRLQSPPIVNGDETFELRGTYQQQHTRIEDLNQPCWFTDQLWHVAQAGLLWQGYLLGDRATSMVVNQYDLFQKKMVEAWRQEDAGSADFVYPAEGSIGGFGA